MLFWICVIDIGVRSCGFCWCFWGSKGSVWWLCYWGCVVCWCICCVCWVGCVFWVVCVEVLGLFWWCSCLLMCDYFCYWGWWSFEDIWEVVYFCVGCGLLLSERCCFRFDLFDCWVSLRCDWVWCVWFCWWRLVVGCVWGGCCVWWGGWFGRLMCVFC